MRNLCTIFIAAALIIFLSSCKMFQRKGNPRQGQLYENALASYKQGNVEEAVSGFTLFIKEFPKSRNRAKAHYFRGRACLAAKRYAEAEKDFNKALDVGKPSFIKSYARIGLGDICMERDHFEQARHYYGRALHGNAKNLPEAEILYKMGKAAQRSGMWSQAGTYFTKVISKYPENQFAERAREKISSGVRYFSIQVGAFSERKNALEFAKKLENLGYVSIKEE